LINRRQIEHAIKELMAQRVCALAVGYEDLNDHDQLRYDSTGAGSRKHWS
jgi:hypothetical protein